MPIYEYECQSCGTRTEALQRFADPPLETCECGEEGKLKKLISAPAFQFKGDGWYVTDYARKDDKGKKAEDKKATGSESKDSKDSASKNSEPTKAKSSGKSEKEASSGKSSSAD